MDSVGIYMNGKFNEWDVDPDTYTSQNIPRLPIPHAFLQLVSEKPSQLIAICQREYDGSENYLFSKAINPKKILTIRRECDLILVWGKIGLLHCLLDMFLPQSKRKTMFICYDWWVEKTRASFSRTIYLKLQRFLAAFSHSVIVMTEEQKISALRYVGNKTFVRKINIALDAKFYRKKDINHKSNDEVMLFLKTINCGPYLVMLGDELRDNFDAILVCQLTQIPVVRVAQHMSNSTLHSLQLAAKAAGVADIFFVMQSISHHSLRHLVQNSIAYLGLVNSSWQPAGWTAAVESLCCGVRVILYEGLVSRELKSRGIPVQGMHVVENGNIESVIRKVSICIKNPLQETEKLYLKKFVDENLSIDKLYD